MNLQAIQNVLLDIFDFCSKISTNRVGYIIVIVLMPRKLLEVNDPRPQAALSDLDRSLPLISSALGFNYYLKHVEGNCFTNKSTFILDYQRVW